MQDVEIVNKGYKINIIIYWNIAHVIIDEVNNEYNKSIVYI